MATALNQMGDPVNVGDRVSIIGNVSSVSGSQNENATVTITSPLTANTFTVTITDVITTVSNTTEGAGMTGNQVAAGQDCTVTGVVTAISGTGNTATLTVSTSVNATSIKVAAGACYSDNV